MFTLNKRTNKETQILEFLNFNKRSKRKYENLQYIIKGLLRRNVRNVWHEHESLLVLNRNFGIKREQEFSSKLSFNSV